MNVDGATVAGGVIHLGLDRFGRRSVGWPVFALRGSQWVRTDLSGRHDGWDAQGSLTTIGGRAWAVRFDQRPGRIGLQTRLVVRAMDHTGDGHDVGAPLVTGRRFFGLLYWGLATVRGRVYAMATVPRPRARRNEVRLFVLDEQGIGA